MGNDNMATTCIKASLDNDLRRFSVGSDISLDDLTSMLASRFAVPSVSLAWIDEDGDSISVVTKDDLREMLSGRDKVRLVLTAGSPPPRTGEQKSAGAPAKEHVKDSIAQMTSALGIDLPEEKLAEVAAGLSKLGPVMSNIAHNATQAFQKAAASSQQDEAKKAADALRGAAESARAAMEQAMKKQGIEQATEHIRQRGKAGEEKVKQAAEVMREQLQAWGARAAEAMKEKFKEMEAEVERRQEECKMMEGSTETRPSEPAGCAPEAVHFGVSCDCSGMAPIVGCRWHRIGHDFDLCDEEFQKLSETDKACYECMRRPGDSPVPYAEGATKDSASGNADGAATSVASTVAKLGLAAEDVSSSMLLDLQGALDPETSDGGDWDDLMADLAEMGFDDLTLNRRVLHEAKGDLKDAVKALVRSERQGLPRTD